jgi:MinD-like ATPase involved in chromosome partitioning or flagellar assembly
VALIAVASAKGAPGVTTFAVALSALAPRRAVLADLDPGGGDLVLRYPAPDGQPLNPDRGLLSLGADVRRDPAAPFPPHVQLIAGGLEVLVGASSPEQMTALGPVWPVLGRIMQSAPQRDVIADCGRVTVGSPTLPVLQAANVLVMLARDSVEQLAHLRERLFALGPMLGPATRTCVVIVAPEKNRATMADTQRLLASAGLQVPVLGVLADDPKGARMLAGAEAGSAGRSTLVRSMRSIVPAVYGLLGEASPRPASSGAPRPPVRRPQGEGAMS